MNPNNNLFPIEEGWKSRLSHFSNTNCPEAKEIIELAERGERSSEFETRMQHVLLCAVCRETLLGIRKNQALERKVRGGWRLTVSDILTGLGNWRLAAVPAAAFTLAAFIVWLVMPKPVVTLNDSGHQVTLSSNGHIDGLPPLPAGLEIKIAEFMKTGKLEEPASLKILKPPADAANEPAKFETYGPMATIILSTQPEFSWKLPPKAQGCTINLERVDTAGHILEKKRIDMNKTNKTADRWKPKKPLLPGAIYYWQISAYDKHRKVTASAPSRPDIARFQVMDSGTAKYVEATRKSLKSSPLALKVFNASEGCF